MHKTIIFYASKKPHGRSSKPMVIGGRLLYLRAELVMLEKEDAIKQAPRFKDEVVLNSVDLDFFTKVL